MSSGDVASEDTGLQPVVGVVGNVDRLLVVVNGDHRHDRPEDLLASNCHLRCDAIEDLRRHEEAAIIRAELAVVDQFGTFGSTDGDVTVHLVELFVGDEGAEQIVRMKRVAHRPVLRLGNDVVKKFVLHCPRNNESRIRCAVLAHIPERCVHCMLGHRLEIPGVRKDDAGILSTAFEHRALEIRVCRVVKEESSNLSRTGEGNRTDTGVEADGAARGFAQPRDDIEYPIGNSRFGCKSSNLQCRHARLFGGLHDDA
ncbi:unannotated protein [freshwater metagenome]|uniref:Unannotated protein n=1 Tax=freshwater metagenome TaxID=449393 RepID=A0A6J7JTE2_9ZZZZ